MSGPSDLTDAPRCDWASRKWGACIREPSHKGKPHLVIDMVGDLVHVPPRSRRTDLHPVDAAGGVFTPISKPYWLKEWKGERAEYI